MKTKIYGASDDLVEIEGGISEEINLYITDVINLFCSDGTQGTISYDGDWNIDIIEEGTDFLKLVRGNDEIPHTDEDAIGCSSYSDVLVMGPNLKWIKIGNKKISK